MQSMKAAGRKLQGYGGRRRFVIWLQGRLKAEGAVANMEGAHGGLAYKWDIG